MNPPLFHRELAKEVIEELFPEGVYPITSETFHNQNLMVNKVTNRLRNDHQRHIQTLGLTEIVDHIEDLNTEFTGPHEPENEGVDYDEVRAAHTEAGDASHRLVAVVIGEYTNDMETLNEVMRPVLEQTERTRRHMARRGTVPPVDSESGEPVDPDKQDSTDGGSPDDDSPNDGDAPNDGDNETTPDENDGS